jgi:acyl-CoA thioester hydrolase
MHLEYLTPARIDDVLEVETRVAEVRGAALQLAQRVIRGETVLFEAEVLVVLVSVSGKPQRLSQRLRAGLSSG